MIAALYILAALVVVGAALWLLEVRYRHTAARAAGQQPATPEKPADDGCCGMHITCERDSLLAGVSDNIEYFDDEELDIYAGRRPDEYGDDETEQFRDVLLTLLPDDIAPWARSLQLRGIELPTAVRDELLMIVAETRESRTHTTH